MLKLFKISLWVNALELVFYTVLSSNKAPIYLAVHIVETLVSAAMLGSVFLIKFD